VTDLYKNDINQRGCPANSADFFDFVAANPDEPICGPQCRAGAWAETQNAPKTSMKFKSAAAIGLFGVAEACFGD
jgi:hypothetical protein